MPATYDSLQTTVLTSATDTVTFSNISQSYTDLVLVCNAWTVSSTTYYGIRFNGDSSTNYNTIVVRGNGSNNTVGSYAGSNEIYTSNGSPVSTSVAASAMMTNIMDYRNTSRFKTVISRDINANIESNMSVGSWASTAAITSITVRSGVSGPINFAIGSSFSLYGIARA